MSDNFYVSMEKLVKEFSLEKIFICENSEKNKVTNSEVNRPSAFFAGFYKYFDSRRIQIIGKVEISFLRNLDDETRKQRINDFFERQIPCVIVTRGLEIFPEMIDAAAKKCIPILRTKETTSSFIAGLIAFLNLQLAPRITRHGVLVEVYGEGVLLLGESGVGKSETAIELIKRGHRLIADDAVEIRKVSNKTLVGTSPENIRHFLELRGIGVINARRLFGMGAVKMTEKIDMVVKMENWNPDKIYDRLGMTNEYTNILGISVPSVTIPIKPGRNLAVILEVAAMNHRQKKMGYNPTKELLSQLGMEEQFEDDDFGSDDFDKF